MAEFYLAAHKNQISVSFYYFQFEVSLFCFFFAESQPKNWIFVKLISSSKCCLLISNADSAYQAHDFIQFFAKALKSELLIANKLWWDLVSSTFFWCCKNSNWMQSPRFSQIPFPFERKTKNSRELKMSRIDFDHS